MSDSNANATTEQVDLQLVDNKPEPTSTEAVDDGVSEEGSEGFSDSESEFETVDLAQSELYQVLTCFLSRTPEEGADDDEPTENVTDVLAGLKDSVDTLNGLLKTAITTIATAQQKSSSRTHRTRPSSSKKNSQ